MMIKRLIPPSDEVKEQKTNPEFERCKSEKRKIDEFEPNVEITFPSQIEISLLEIRKKFLSQKFSAKFPPVIFPHQLPEFDKNTILINKNIGQLENEGKIKLITIGCNTVVLFNHDVVTFLKDNVEDYTERFKNFMEVIWPKLPSNCIEKQVLKTTYSISDKSISNFIHRGLLVIQEDSSYSLSFPGAGDFMKYFYKGRNALLKLIEKSKYKELLVQEIEQKPLNKTVLLGVDYQIADIIGANLVKSVKTTSGILLQYTGINESQKRKKYYL